MSSASEYERRAWRDLEARRARFMADPKRRLIPDVVTKQVGRASKKAEEALAQLPKYDEVRDLFYQALQGFGLGSAAAISTSIRTPRIVEAHRGAGNQVSAISDLRTLDLQLVDQVKPKINLGYLAASGLTGAGTGLVITGGEIVAASGAGSAPGVPLVISAMVADTAAVIAACMRLTLHTGAYYGFDPQDPDEQLRALSVLNLSTSLTQASKQRAYAEVSTLAQLLYRGAPWKELQGHALVKVITEVLARLGFRVTKQRVAMLVPFVSAFFGAGINMFTVGRTIQASDLVFREAFLRGKGLGDGDFEPNVSVGDVRPPDDDSIPIVEIVEEELAEEGLDTEPGAFAGFALQLDPQEIDGLAERYAYKDDSAAIEAGKRAAERGFYNRKDAVTVCEWKSKRTVGKLEANADSLIESETRRAMASADEAERMGALLELSGVGIPVASALLHFAYPDDYPILDVRALQSLGYSASRTTYSIPFWLRYLSACRDIASRNGVSMRTLDKALWQFSKEQ